MPETQVAMDAGEMFTILTLVEKSARDAREGFVTKQQVDAEAQKLSSGLVVAGTGVLARIQNGDAAVARDVQGPTAEEAQAKAVQRHLQQLIDASLLNIINLGALLGQKLKASGA